MLANYIHTVFVQVDDVQFTISFAMWLKLTWVDNHLKIDTKNGTSRAMYRTINPNITVLELGNDKILDHIWVPEVSIPHKKLSKCQHGPPFHDQVINIVVNNRTVWVDLWSLVKPTITCPMSFNWFPFDVQSCFLNIQVRKLTIFITFYNKILVRNSTRVHGLRKPA